MPKTKAKPRKLRLKQLPIEQFLRPKIKNEKVGTQRGDKIVVSQTESVEGGRNQLDDIAVRSTSDDIVDTIADELLPVPIRENSANTATTNHGGMPLNIEAAEVVERATASGHIDEHEEDVGDTALPPTMPSYPPF